MATRRKSAVKDVPTIYQDLSGKLAEWATNMRYMAAIVEKK